MPVFYAIVLLVAVTIALASFFVAGRAVHAPHRDRTNDDADPPR